MKKLFLAALLAGALAACSGKNTKVKVVDSNTDTGQTTCSPLTNTGCAMTEKCTWVIDQTDPTYVGHIGCVPAGSAAVGADCMYGAPGATGYDNCAKGAVCSAFRTPGSTGQCKAVCDNNGGDPMCDNQHVCVTYAKLFSTGSTSPAAAGVCNASCDPMLDNDFDGSGSASSRRPNDPCGSDITQGCYGAPSAGTPPVTGFSCTHDIHMGSDGTDPNFRHRTECTTATGCADAETGIAYLNECNQGYEPLFIEATGNTTTICVAMCQPIDCYDGSGGHCGGTGNPNRHGIYPNTCDPVRRIGMFNTQPGHEECSYLWAYERDGSGNWLPSNYSDTVGFCYDHSMYKYDPTGGSNPSISFPGCEAVQLHGTHETGSGNPNDPTSYFGAVDGAMDCVNSGLAFGSGSAQGKRIPDPEGITIDRPRFLYHRELAGEPPREAPRN